jgi:DNA-directed RNA polymerase subunit K/omega
MIELPEGFDSIFRYIVVVSQRAEQLINGAKPRIDSRHAKPTLEARDDVDAGTVDWRVLTQEELDAQRQAIVDQFRAEVAGEEFAPEQGQLVPDVLPTGTEGPEPVVEEGGERDDELARLQRLLGMVGEEREPEAEDLEAVAEEAEDLTLDIDESADESADADKDEEKS